ncbi:26530_t:CDS:2, partial [Racocetra persica]
KLTMLETMFARSSLFKRIIKLTKELVNDVNFRFTESGKVLNRASDNDTLILKLKENTTDRLYVIFINPDNGKETKYEIGLLDIDQEQIDIPAVVYNIFIEIAFSEFKRIYQDQTIAGNHLTITTNQETGIVNLNTKDDINIG